MFQVKYILKPWFLILWSTICMHLRVSQSEWWTTVKNMHLARYNWLEGQGSGIYKTTPDRDQTPYYHCILDNTVGKSSGYLSATMWTTVQEVDGVIKRSNKAGVRPCYQSPMFKENVIWC